MLYLTQAGKILFKSFEYKIGTDGAVNFEYVNPNFRVRLDPDVLMAAAKAALK